MAVHRRGPGLLKFSKIEKKIYQNKKIAPTRKMRRVEFSKKKRFPLRETLVFMELVMKN